jgi:hypothetical protein
VQGFGELHGHFFKHILTFRFGLVGHELPEVLAVRKAVVKMVDRVGVFDVVGVLHLFQSLAHEKQKYLPVKLEVIIFDEQWKPAAVTEKEDERFTDLEGEAFVLEALVQFQKACAVVAMEAHAEVMVRCYGVVFVQPHACYRVGEPVHLHAAGTSEQKGLNTREIVG